MRNSMLTRVINNERVLGSNPNVSFHTYSNFRTPFEPIEDRLLFRRPIL